MDQTVLQQKLGVVFSNPDLLQRALTHRSADSRNNERLEYLGDAILGFIVAEKLYDMYPDAREGELSRYRARLVRGETLAELAKELELGEYLRLGSGELKSGGYRRDSILADALEGVIGALYLDQGMQVTRSIVLDLYGDRVVNLIDGEDLKDSKTRLQEYLQAKKVDLPVYSVIEVTGQPHEQQFRVECRIADVAITEHGSGSSRRRAEQDAARKALNSLLHE